MSTWNNIIQYVDDYIFYTIPAPTTLKEIKKKLFDDYGITISMEVLLNAIDALRVKYQQFKDNTITLNLLVLDRENDLYKKSINSYYSITRR